MADNRTVELRLNIRMPQEAKRALEETARQMDKAAVSQARLNERMRETASAARSAATGMHAAGGATYGRMGPGGIHVAPGGLVLAASRGLAGPAGPSSDASGGDRGGMFLAGGFGRAAGLAAALAASVQSANAIVGGLENDRFLRSTGATPDERWRAGLQSTALTRPVLEYADAVSGRTTDIQSANRTHQRRMAGIGADERARLAQNDLLLEQRIATANLMPRDNSRVEGFRLDQDRSTVRGEREFRENLIRRENARREQQAGYEARQAVFARQETELARGDATRHREAMQQDAETLSRQAGAARGADRVDLLNRQAAALKLLESAIADEQRLIQASVSARRAENQAIEQSKQARLDTMRAELSMLQQREQTAAGQARTFGQMNAYERQQSIDAARMVKQAGPEGLDYLPDEIRQRARAVAPETIGKIEEEAGRRFLDQQRAFRKEFQDEYRDRLPDVRKLVEAQQTKIEVQVKLDAEAARKAAAEAVTQGIADQLRQAMDALKAAIMAEVDRQARAARANR